MVHHASLHGKSIINPHRAKVVTKSWHDAGARQNLEAKRHWSRHNEIAPAIFPNAEHTAWPHAPRHERLDPAGWRQNESRRTRTRRLPVTWFENRSRLARAGA